MVLSRLQEEMVKDREAGRAAVHGVAESLGASLTCRELSEPVMLLFSQAAAHPRAVRSALRVRHLEA